MNAIHDILLAWSQSYYWMPEWQGKERRADEQAQSGASKTFGAVEDLIEELQD